MARFLYQVHIADGFVDDCEELIQRCTRLDTVTYTIFADIWKEMNFGSIYQGRTLGAEVAELSEEVILIAKRFMLANTGNYEEQVAGLFLVYGLINLQPFAGLASLRLVPDDVPAIGRIEMIARRDRRLDVLYILGQILVKGPVQYCAAEREYGFEASYRKYHEGLKQIDRRGIRPLGLFKRQNDEFDALREIKHVYRLYHSIKKDVTDDKPDRNLNYSNEDAFEEADVNLKKLLNGDIVHPHSHPGRVSVENEHYKRSSKVNEIRWRAMKHTVDSIKHLTGIEQRVTSPRKPYTRKGGPPKKQSSPKETSGRKRKLCNRYMKGKGKGKRSRKYSSSESESFSDDNLSLASDDEMDNHNRLKDTIELDITEFKKANSPEAIKNIISEAFSDNIPRQNIAVQVPLADSLPVVISSDPSQNYEIEIIDNYEKKDEKTEPDDDVSSETLNKPLKKREHDLKNATYIAEKNPDNMETKNSEEELFKKPLVRSPRSGAIPVRKKERGKGRLAAALKRMGLVAIANLDSEYDNKVTRKRKENQNNSCANLIGLDENPEV